MCPGSGVKHTETESKAWAAVGGWEEAGEQPKRPNWPFLLWLRLPLFVCSDTGAATLLAAGAKQQAQQSQLAGSSMVGFAGKWKFAKGSAGKRQKIEPEWNQLAHCTRLETG